MKKTQPKLKPKLKSLSFAQWEKIIKRLPRTKDGMPVIPSVDRVYHPELLDLDGITPDALQYNDYNYLWTSPVHDCSRPVEECYSTVGLAKRAMKRK